MSKGVTFKDRYGVDSNKGRVTGIAFNTRTKLLQLSGKSDPDHFGVFNKTYPVSSAFETKQVRRIPGVV